VLVKWNIMNGEQVEKGRDGNQTGQQRGSLTRVSRVGCPTPIMVERGDERRWARVFGEWQRRQVWGLGQMVPLFQWV
jgi:hypothetical protein